MSDDLTSKQEAFCQKVAAGETQTAAYKHAYSTEGMKDKTVWEEASKLAASPKVAARLFEIHQAAQERTLVTVESLTRELNEAREIAQIGEDAQELRQNTMAKAKLHGLDVHKIEAKGNFSVNITGDDAEL